MLPPTLECVAVGVPAHFPSYLRSGFELDQEDILAAETAANLLVEIFTMRKEVCPLNWEEHVLSAIANSCAAQVAFSRYAPDARNLRGGTWVIANGLSVLVKCGMITIDESTPIDLFVITQGFTFLFQ